MPRHDRGSFGIGALSLGAIVSAVAGAHKITESLIHLRKLHDVGADNMVYVRIIDRVRIDLAEVDRLLALKAVKFALSRSPEKVAWIRKTIATMRQALQEMSHFTMRVRKDTDRGKRVGIRNRIVWRLDEHEKLEIHSAEVARCHESLLQVLGFLTALEPLACCERDEQGQGQYYGAGGVDQYNQNDQYGGRGQQNVTIEEYDRPYTRGGEEVHIERRIETERERPAHTHGRFEEDFVEVDRKIEIERHRPHSRSHEHDERYIDIERRAEVERHPRHHHRGHHTEGRFVERDGERSIEIDRYSDHGHSHGHRDDKVYYEREYRRSGRDEPFDLTGRLANKLAGGLSKL